MRLPFWWLRRCSRVQNPRRGCFAGDGEVATCLLPRTLGSSDLSDKTRSTRNEPLEGLGLTTSECFNRVQTASLQRPSSWMDGSENKPEVRNRRGFGPDNSPYFSNTTLWMKKAEVVIAKADPGELPKRVPRKCHPRGTYMSLGAAEAGTGMPLRLHCPQRK